MKCLVCNNMMKDVIRGEAEFHHQGKLVVVKNLNYFECEVCGERVFSSSVADSILKKLQTKQTTEYITVPVYS
ncbi:MAG: YgiT-type zinc finger protein [Ignavibacteriae bacterium]|nr:YgiT-type zinc finger protein [Ignavibacteriota bacterium]